MVFFIWIACSVGVGFIANSRGRSGVAGFFAALILSPLLTGLYYMLTEKGEMSTCPACKESVKPDAVRCKHCQVEIVKKAEPKRAVLLLESCRNCKSTAVKGDRECRKCGCSLIKVRDEDVVSSIA